MNPFDAGSMAKLSTFGAGSILMLAFWFCIGVRYRSHDHTPMKVCP